MRILWQGCQNRKMRLETKLYRNSVFCQKNFQQSFGQGAGKLRPSGKIFRGKFVETGFDVSSGIVLEKQINNPENCCLFFSSDFERKFFALLAGNFGQACKICALMVHRIFFRKTNSFFGEIFYPFRTLTEIFSAFLKVFRRVVKTEFHVPIGIPEET